MRRQTALHWAFAKLGPQTGKYTPVPSNIGEVAMLAVTVYARLMFANANSVGCGGRLHCIGHSQNRALDSAISHRRLNTPWFDTLTV